MSAAPDPPYWRRRPAPSDLVRLGDERYVSLTTSGPDGTTLTTTVRPVRDGHRLLLSMAADPELLDRLRDGAQVTLTPCDNRGRPRAARALDAADPVASTRRADPVPGTARLSPGDERRARVLLAGRYRLAAGFGSAVETVRRLLGHAPPPVVVVEVRLTAPAA